MKRTLKHKGSVRWQYVSPENMPNFTYFDVVDGDGQELADIFKDLKRGDEVEVTIKVTKRK